MARVVQPQAERGSQKWIQKLVNDRPEILNSRVWSGLDFSGEEDVEWLSPLRSDDYAEYSDRAFLNRLEVNPEEIHLSRFWPRGGPRWDALGRSSAGKLFLVEAKSHISELISGLRARDEKSKCVILKSLEETRQYVRSKAQVDWSRGFYQYTNRLAHLYFLRKNSLPAYLVHVYFLNDVEVGGPTMLEEWKGAVKLLNFYLGIGRHRLQKFMTDVYVDVQEL